MASLAFVSFSSFSWRLCVVVVSVAWVGAVILSQRGNEMAQKLLRLGLCACLGLGLGMVGYGLLVLYVGHQDSPVAALVGVLYAQVVLTLPCIFLLFINRFRS